MTDDGVIDEVLPEAFDDPLRIVASHLGNALVNALSDGVRDDGLILSQVKAAAECCADQMDDTDAFLPVYAVYEFLGGDVSGLRGIRDRDQTDVKAVVDAVMRRADDMPL